MLHKSVSNNIPNLLLSGKKENIFIMIFMLRLDIVDS